MFKYLKTLRALSSLRANKMYAAPLPVLSYGKNRKRSAAKGLAHETSSHGFS